MYIMNEGFRRVAMGYGGGVYDRRTRSRYQERTSASAIGGLFVQAHDYFDNTLPTAVLRINGQKMVFPPNYRVGALWHDDDFTFGAPSTIGGVKYWLSTSHERGKWLLYFRNDRKRVPDCVFDLSMTNCKYDWDVNEGTGQGLIFKGPVKAVQCANGITAELLSLTILPHS